MPNKIIFIVIILLLSLNSIALSQNIQKVQALNTEGIEKHSTELTKEIYANENPETDYINSSDIKEYKYEDFIKFLVNSVKIGEEKLLENHYVHFIFMIDTSRSVDPIIYASWRSELFWKLLEDFLIEKGVDTNKSDKLSIAPFRLHPNFSLYNAEYKRNEPYKDLYIPEGYTEGEGTDYITSLVEVLDKLTKDGLYTKENIVIILVTDEYIDNATPLQDRLKKFKSTYGLKYSSIHYEVSQNGKSIKDYISIYYNNFPDKSFSGDYNRYQIIMNQNQGGNISSIFPEKIPTLTPLPTFTPTPTIIPTSPPPPTMTSTSTQTPTPTPTPIPILSDSWPCNLIFIIIIIIIIILFITVLMLREKVCYIVKTNKGEETRLTFGRRANYQLKKPAIGKIKLEGTGFFNDHFLTLYPEKEYIIRDSSGREAQKLSTSRRRNINDETLKDKSVLDRHILGSSEKETGKENKFTYKKKEVSEDIWEEIAINVSNKGKTKDKKTKNSKR